LHKIDKYGKNTYRSSLKGKQIAMDYKANQKKANRILYITVVVILCIMTIIVGVTTAAQRRQKPSVNDLTTPKHTTVKPQETMPDETEPVNAGTEEPVNGDTDDEGGKPVENKLPTFIMPVNGSISKMHDEDAPVYSLTMEDYRIHLGVDISSTLGQAVLAAADGVISQVYEDPMMGTCIVISHSGDAKSIYKNLAPELPAGIEEGVTVMSGQTIASVGESAIIEISDEPHIHYELKIADKWEDPLDYFPASTGASSDTAYEG